MPPPDFAGFLFRDVRPDPAALDGRAPIVAAARDELERLEPFCAPEIESALRGLAARLGVSQLLAKDEGRRMLGSFKSLGGTYAGLRVLARIARMDIEDLIARRPENRRLVCLAQGGRSAVRR